MTRGALRILNLGCVEYLEAVRIQEDLVAQRHRGEVPDTLILLEHPPVITLGRGARADTVLLSEAGLAARGIALHRCTRGGDVTYHGPGQLVGYPIFDLRDHGRDVLRFCRSVEGALIYALTQYGLHARQVPGYAGVWVGERKVASLGISVRRWVTFHGFALNANDDLSPFGLIRPCGLAPHQITSIQELLGHPVAMGELRARVTDGFAQAFARSAPEPVGASP